MNRRTFSTKPLKPRSVAGFAGRKLAGSATDNLILLELEWLRDEVHISHHCRIPETEANPLKGIGRSEEI